MTAIWRRELQGYFYTPVGYVFMAVFLALSSLLFYMDILSQRSGDLLTFLYLMGYFWMLLCPLLTMRTLAGERTAKTDRLLLTTPVSLPAIVIGKYLAAVTVLLLTSLMTLGFVAVVAVYGTVYPAELAVGYLGFLLEGCAFLAVDLFVSGCVKGTVTSAFLAFGVNIVLWLIDLLAEAVNMTDFESVVSFFSLYSRNEPFVMGQLSFASIGFDLSFILIFIVLAIHRLDARRYRGA